MVLVILPNFGIVLYSNTKVRQSATREAELNALRMAQLASASFDQLVSGSRQLLVALAEVPPVRSRDPEASRSLFSDLARQYPWYTTIAAASPNGDVYASATPQAGPVNVSDRSYFKRALVEKGFVVGDYQIGRLTGKTNIPAAFPILNSSGQVDAVLVVGIDVGFLNGIMEQLNLPEGAVMFVIDREGTVITRHPEPEKFVGKDASDVEVVRDILASGKDGTTHGRGLDGVPRMFGFTRLKEGQAGSFLTVGIPDSVALAQINQLLKIRLLTLLGTAALALVAAWALVFVVVRPMRRLISETEEVASGDFDVRSGLGVRKDELGELARAFDEMASGLKQRQEEIDRSRLFLQVSEEKYHGLFDSLKEGIIMTDMEGKILDCNQACLDLIGSSETDLRGMDYSKLVPEKWLEHEQRIIADQVMVKGYSDPYEKEHLRKDGTTFPVICTKLLIKDKEGKPQGIWSITTDITERKKAELALKESEEKYRSLFQNMTEGFALCEIILDEKGNPSDFRYLDLNRAWEKMTGLPPDMALGKKATEVFPGLERHWTDTLGAVALSGEPAHIENFLGALDRWFDVYAYSPKKGYFVVLFRDTTDRKKAEERLKQASEELARSNKELEQFAYIASHDLQEPLRMISSFIQLLDKRYKGKLDQDADEFIGFVVSGASRMQIMINDLLAYSRVGTRGKPPEPVECENVFSQAMENLKISLEESGAAVTHDPLPAVMADSSQMVQLFQNLIGNAVKFRREGEQAKVHVSAQRKTTEWVFSVKDNGIGISRESFDRLFQVFQRFQPQAKYPGSGIGLAICKKIVERHGGRIWVESEPGKGSTFYFTVPSAKRS